MSRADTSSRRWFEVTLFVVLGFISIGVPLIPMGLSANSIAFPDIMFALFAAWIIRRPATAPLVAIVFSAVLADAFMMRPMGLWALMLFIGMEVLRFSERGFREIPFVLEWLYVSILFAALLMLQNILLFLSFDSVYGISYVVRHWGGTVAVYPLIAAFLHWGVKIKPVEKSGVSARFGNVL